MYFRNPMPSGPHTTYILKDEIEPRFKFGMSADLETRRKKICNEIYGRHSYKKITEYWSSPFQSFFAAFCVEQAALSILQRYGFQPVMSPDWFAIDNRTLTGVVILLEDLAHSIRAWENESYVMEYNFCGSRYQPHPYGKYLRANRLGEHELKDAMLDHASRDFLDEYIDQIERQRNRQRR